MKLEGGEMRLRLLIMNRPMSLIELAMGPSSRHQRLLMELLFVLFLFEKFWKMVPFLLMFSFLLFIVVYSNYYFPFKL